MAVTQKEILDALSFVIEPDLKKDIISLDLVSDVNIEGNQVSFTVKINNPAMHSRKRMAEACEHHVKVRVSQNLDVKVNIEPIKKVAPPSTEGSKSLPGVKHVIAVASGKGGVGKSTITANLAMGLAMKGYKVGLIDADVYGPSMPMMFDVTHKKPGAAKVNDKNRMVPVESYGVKIMSLGFFAGADQAVAWRGPMAVKALDQMINDTDWGTLDFMLIDLPPGTGDIHLSIVKAASLSGALIVSTPQNIALADARKGVAMFKMDSIGVPVLGLIENMSWFTPAELPDNKYFIFGQDGGKNLAEQLQIPLLGQIPLVQSIREASDVGRPAIMQESTPQAKALMEMVDNIVQLDQVKSN